MLRSNPDDPQTNPKKKILCKNYLGYILHLFLCSQLICLLAKKNNLFHLNSSANQSSSFIHRVIWGVIFCFSKAWVWHDLHLWYVLASRNENSFLSDLMPTFSISSLKQFSIAKHMPNSKNLTEAVTLHKDGHLQAESWPTWLQTVASNRSLEGDTYRALMSH